MTRKIIFLDVDGVLVTTKSMEHWCDEFGCHSFDPQAVRVLNQIVYRTGAEIVLSSTWRFLHNKDEFNELASQSNLHYPIIEYTPFFGHRNNEIKKWLSNNPDVADYLVIDDEDLSLDFEKFIRTEIQSGLNPNHLNDAVRILGEKQ